VLSNRGVCVAHLSMSMVATTKYVVNCNKIAQNFHTY